MPDRKCLHFVARSCTACLCRWQDKKDAKVCTLGGVLEADYLTAKIRDLTTVPKRVLIGKGVA